SFCESIFFPVPPDLMLIAMVVAKRARWLYFATLTTLTSVAGGIVGYTIGWYFFEWLGQPLVEFYGYGDLFQNYQNLFQKYGLWIVMLGGLTPIPYKLVCIASGALNIAFIPFLVGSVLSRGLRFVILSLLLWWFGPTLKGWMESYFGILTSAIFVLMILGFIIIKWL
ncbi:MAG: VTT domain-containing protein, partial [Pseudomonadota bacterium]